MIILLVINIDGLYIDHQFAILHGDRSFVSPVCRVVLEHVNL